MFLKSAKSMQTMVFNAPMRDGFILALLNPKSYPVLLSVLGSVFLHYDGLMLWSHFAEIFIFCVLGFVLGYGFMVFAAGLKLVKAVYVRHIRGVFMVFGAIFIYFGIMVLSGVFRLLM